MIHNDIYVYESGFISMSKMMSIQGRIRDLIVIGLDLHWTLNPISIG